MKRFPPINENDFTAAQRRMAAKVQKSGPFQSFLRAPELWEAIQPCRQFLANHSIIHQRAREAAILCVAHYWRCESALEAHVKLGVCAGLDNDIITAIQNDHPIEIEDAAIEAAISATRALLADKSLSDSLFERVRQTLGERGIIELAGLIGFFTMICLALNIDEGIGIGAE